jgi:hypothetical protein
MTRIHTSLIRGISPHACSSKAPPTRVCGELEPSDRKVKTPRRLGDALSDRTSASPLEYLRFQASYGIYRFPTAASIGVCALPEQTHPSSPSNSSPRGRALSDVGQNYVRARNELQRSSHGCVTVGSYFEEKFLNYRNDRTHRAFCRVFFLGGRRNEKPAYRAG